jgi:glycosyltransferase involved in cell wall biosynthesis
MPDSKPLVTIGAINYNNEKHVIETLDSIANQTYENIELIVVDDASTDNSLTLIKDWLKNYKKPYKLIVHSENMNVHAGYMSVIKNATGEFLSIVATDDVLVNEKTEKQVEAFANLGDEYGAVYGDVVETDASGEIIREPNFENIKKFSPDWTLPQGDVFSKFVTRFFFYVQAALFRLSILNDFYFPEKYICEDRYFILFVANKSKIFGNENVTVFYRRHNESIVAEYYKKDNYYLWVLSNIHLLINVSKFINLSTIQLTIINIKIQEELIRYSCQKSSSYIIALKEWFRTWQLPQKKHQLYSLWYINWYFIKKLFGYKLPF